MDSEGDTRLEKSSGGSVVREKNVNAEPSTETFEESFVCEITTVHRPWGSYTTLKKEEGFQVKHIVVRPGQRLSLQLHKHRSEHWTIVKGAGEITLGSQQVMLQENERIYIPRETKHRVANHGVIPLEFVEVQIGDYLEEDDIVRFADDYGRV